MEETLPPHTPDEQESRLHEEKVSRRTFMMQIGIALNAAAERLTRLAPLQDQVVAGAEMWVLNSFVFLIPAILITVHLLSPKALRPASSR